MLSKPQRNLLREIKKRGELYWDAINMRFLFTGNPMRVDRRTVEALYKLELVTETRSIRSGCATVITTAGRAALGVSNEAE